MKKVCNYKIVCRGCGKIFEPFLKHLLNCIHTCPYCDVSNTYKENAYIEDKE